MGTHNNTREAAGGLQPDRPNLEDVTGRVQDLAGTLTCYVEQAFIDPKALPLWLAGFRHLEAHDLNTPEN